MPYQTVTTALMDSPRPAFNHRAWPAAAHIDVWTAPDGWPHRRLSMGSGARGRMLVVNGRADMLEKFIEPIAHWAAQGWAVTAFDWRGQGGSGRLTKDPLVGHIADFAQWVADLGAFVADWRARGEGPYVIVGHSMGGHLLLRALAEKAVIPDAAVMIAPMFGLNGGLIPGRVARLIVRLMSGIAGIAAPAWTQNERSAVQLRARQGRLTHSIDRYADELWWRAQHPEVSLGPPSWGWLAAAYRSTAMMERSPALADIRLPVLILATRADKLVLPKAIVRIARRLPDARLHLYGPEAAHEILREDDAIRDDAFARIDAFLDARTPAP